MALNNIRKNFLARIKYHLKKDKFIPLNDMFSYGITENTIHIHLVPKDLHDLKNSLSEEQFNSFLKSKFEDFLSKLQQVVRDDSSINSVFAVSPIFFHENWRRVHEDFGFNKVQEIVLGNNDGMPEKQKQMFLDMFEGRRVYYTKMPREKFLLGKYNTIPTDTKNKSRELQ